MTFDVFDSFYPRRLWMWNNLEVQFENQHAQVSPETAYRMSRFSQEFSIEKKSVPFNPDSWKKEKRLIWSCNFASANGFGMVAENTVKTLRELGVNCLNPGSVSGNQVMGAEFVDAKALEAVGQVIYPDCLEIQHCQPAAIRFNVTEKIWCYTMFETTHTPKRWIPLLNQCERILVPSSWLVKSWKEQGVKVPISVIGHGIDPSVYYDLERPERPTFTFLHLGQLSSRKGTDLVVKAFCEEFQGDDKVKLILKNTYPFFPVPFNLPNVEYISATYSKEQMRELYRRADCFVFPTRGEGFGLPPFEAMACGLPTIVTGWSGPADYVDPKDTLILDYTFSRAFEFDKIYENSWEEGENAGEWAEPSLADLRAKMRWAYSHQDQARSMGKKAALRLATSWKWSDKIAELVELVDRVI